MGTILDPFDKQPMQLRRLHPPTYSKQILCLSVWLDVGALLTMPVICHESILPAGPGLSCRTTDPFGSGHCWALSPYCSTCWSPETRRKLTDRICRTNVSWTDRTAADESWSPSLTALNLRGEISRYYWHYKHFICSHRQVRGLDVLTGSVVCCNCVRLCPTQSQVTWRVAPLCWHSRVPRYSPRESLSVNTTFLDSRRRHLSWGLWTLSHEHDIVRTAAACAY